MEFDRDLQRSVPDTCSYDRLKDDMYFHLLVHADDSACAYLDPVYFQSWLAHFRGHPTMDSHLDVKSLRDVTNLLQSRIARTQSTLCLNQERRIVQLVIEYGVHDC